MDAAPSMLDLHSQPDATLEAVIVSGELERRASRAPDFQMENQALVALMKALDRSGGNVLQEVAEWALRLCRANSAGITIAERDGGRDVCRWHAAAGAWSAAVRGTMPRETSPCGAVLERNAPLLMRRPERHFRSLPAEVPRLEEALLVPFQLDEAAAGTLWIVAHDPGHSFDREDLRLLSSLGSVVSAACQLRHETSQARHAQLFEAISTDLVQAKSPDSLYEQILDAAGTMMRAEIASLHIFLRGREELQLLAWQGFDPQSARLWHHVPASPSTVCGYSLRTGTRRQIADVERDDHHQLSARDREACGSSGIRALQSTPLITHSGKRVGMLSTYWREPHEATAGELRFFDVLARLCADLLERASTDTTIRESEERFRQFADAASGVLWVRNAATLAMEYVSPAIQSIYGVERNSLIGHVKRWAALIVPEDRERALELLRRARSGKAVVHEFRIQRPSDNAFRWIRNTDFPLFDERGAVQRIAGFAEDVTEAHLAIEHQAVLLAELQHRVRNIMALMRAIAERTREGVASVPEYADRVSGRLLALSRVQALLTRGANVGVAVRTLVDEQLSAQAHNGQYDVSGPDVVLSPKAAEVLTLAVHELATNAFKYGALSSPHGRVSVRWEKFEKSGDWLRFDWTEQGGPELPQNAAAPRRRGFGSELIEASIPYELGGLGRLNIEADGARCHLEFPLMAGASILQTGAPRRATVFGGALDMAGNAALSGQRILVVDEDYYLACDTARVLQGAGAEVLGPCATEAAALQKIKEGHATGAVVDISVGTGPSFKAANALRDRRVPLVLISGYSDDAIPPEFANTPRLRKPVELRQIVSSLARALNASRQDQARGGGSS